MVALLKLFGLGSVAARAIIRRDDDGDLVAVVVERGGILGIGLMAGIAVHAFFRVRARLPLLHDARRGGGMAFQASFAFFGNLRRLRVKKRCSGENQEDGKWPDSHEPSMHDRLVGYGHRSGLYIHAGREWSAKSNWQRRAG